MAVWQDTRRVRQVWAWNLRAEFFALFETLRSAGLGALVAFDTEFPGVVREGPWTASLESQYEALRCNVGMLRPIQIGLAVAGKEGSILGVWSFNLHFDLDLHLHTEAAVAFLSEAGIDFPRHAQEGVDAKVLGRLFLKSPLVPVPGRLPYQVPWWITFSGLYDLGYLVNLLTAAPLPRTLGEFQAQLKQLCPQRHEIRDWLPHGSLQHLAEDRGLQRRGAAHTAGSDALATLELFLSLTPPGLLGIASEEEDEFRAPPGLSLPLPSAPAAAPAASWGSSARWAAHRTAHEVHAADAAAGCLPTAMPAAPASVWGAAAREAASQLRTHPRPIVA